MATDTLATPAISGSGKTKVYKNFIDGEWVESSSGETFENLNPADTRDVVGIFQKSGKADVDDAMNAAKRAFAKWRLVPAPHRAEIVFRAAEMLFERKEEYARDMTREMGKILKETRGDVQEAVDCAYYMAGEGRRLFGPTTPSELPNKFAMAIRQPIGVCGMIAPWNFPMAIPSWKLLPAIVCGNTCVIKPGEDTPLSTLNLVPHSYRRWPTQGCHQHRDRIRARGWRAAGRASRSAGDFIHRVIPRGSHCRRFCRQESKALLARARRQESHDRARRRQPRTRHRRRTMGCIRHHRPALHGHKPDHRAEGRVSDFISRYVELAKKLKVGNGLNESTEMGPAINERQLIAT